MSTDMNNSICNAANGFDDSFRIGVYFRFGFNGEGEVIINELVESINRILCEANNNRTWNIHRIYVDTKVSGTSDPRTREAFGNLIKDCKEKRINVIVAERLSRISRNIIHILAVLQELRKEGVKLYSLSEGIWYGDINNMTILERAIEEVIHI